MTPKFQFCTCLRNNLATIFKVSTLNIPILLTPARAYVHPEEYYNQSRRFVKKRLPNPYNDWTTAWRITRSTKTPQKCNYFDCAIICVIAIAYTAA
jgi:hypothetical protein